MYASGFSNGAEFTARLAIERSDVLAAAAYSAGGIYAPRPTPARQIPLYMTVGSEDDRIGALPINRSGSWRSRSSARWSTRR